MWMHQSRCSPTQEIFGVHDKKEQEKKQLKILVRQVRFLLNTCVTIMKIVAQSGASRQEHQNNERHTTTKTIDSVANKTSTRCTIS